MEPDDIGRIVLPFIAARLKSNQHGFIAREMARFLAERAEITNMQRDDYAGLISEGIGFLNRAGLLIDATDTVGSNWLKLSRAGLRAVKDAQNFSLTTAPGREARTLLHPTISQAALGDLERGEYDKAVYSAFRALEKAVRAKSGVTSHAKDTFYDAFALKGAQRGPLVPTDMETGEAISLRELFAGAFGAFRNPSAHRDVQDDPAQAMRVLLVASTLHYVLDTIPMATAAAT